MIECEQRLERLNKSNQTTVVGSSIPFENFMSIFKSFKDLDKFSNLNEKENILSNIDMFSSLLPSTNENKKWFSLEKIQRWHYKFNWGLYSICFSCIRRCLPKDIDNLFIPTMTWLFCLLFTIALLTVIALIFPFLVILIGPLIFYQVNVIANMANFNVIISYNILFLNELRHIGYDLFGVHYTPKILLDKIKKIGNFQELNDEIDKYHEYYSLVNSIMVKIQDIKEKSCDGFKIAFISKDSNQTMQELKADFEHLSYLFNNNQTPVPYEYINIAVKTPLTFDTNDLSINNIWIGYTRIMKSLSLINNYGGQDLFFLEADDFKLPVKNYHHVLASMGLALTLLNPILEMKKSAQSWKIDVQTAMNLLNEIVICDDSHQVLIKLMEFDGIVKNMAVSLFNKNTKQQ